jgi:RNA polymerase sigma factor (TIGR02999 family)
VAARLMRRLLVDHARAHHRAKREGDAVKVTLGEALEFSSGPASNVLAVDEALTRLAEFDPRKSEILELRYFGGLNNEEVAEALNISRATVQRDLRLAKTWLIRELKRG